jgi:hypothetical protein
MRSEDTAIWSGRHAAYERLSAMDASQLGLERGGVHMHIGGVSIFEAAPLQGEHGALDVDRIERYVASRLYRLPRYRQRLAWTPLENHPVWIDDASFNLKYHVRYTSLPRHGGERELKRLTGRIISQELDRGKPLWEMWFVDGLPDARVALITKIHHCMVDGIGGASLMTQLMRTDRDDTIEPTRAWLPRPVPSSATMLRDELKRRAGLALAAARAIATALAPREPRRARSCSRRQIDRDQFDSTVATPFNARSAHTGASTGQVGSRSSKSSAPRRHDRRRRARAVFWVRWRLADEASCSRGRWALVPVNMRDREDRWAGNRVSVVIATARRRRDPIQRFGVVEEMRKLKSP